MAEEDDFENKDMEDPKEDDSDLTHLRKSRAGFKSVLTKGYNKIKGLFTDYKNLDIVFTEHSSLSEAWSKFSKAHRLVVTSLGDDEEAIKQESVYYEDAQREMVSQDALTTAWLDKARDNLSKDIKPHDSASQTSSRRSSSSIRLKKIQEESNRRIAEARLRAIDEEFQLDQKKRQLRLKREEEESEMLRQEKLMKARNDLEEAKIREEVYAQAAENASEVNSKIKNNTAIATVNTNMTLNPEAPEWENKHFLPRTSLYSSEEYMKQASAALFLPKPEVQVYKGDPLEYFNFMIAFKHLIEDKTSDASARLHYLVQYTGGDVQELVRSCLSMEPTAGYEEAQRLIKVKYGQSYKIATAYVERITKGSAIKSEDRDGLQKLSILMISCRNTLNSIGYVNKIENPDAYKAIIARLPYDLRKKWRTKADHISEDDCREITFDDIVKFIEREARMASHPIFGDLSTPKDQAIKSHKDTKPKRTSFATVCNAQSPNVDIKPSDEQSQSSISEPPQTNKQSHITKKEAHVNSIGSYKPRPCAVCSKNHKTEECDEFQKLNVDHRADKVLKLGLCFNCLIPKHRVVDCRKHPMCTICKRKHSTLLHRDSYDTSNTNTNQEVCVGATVSKDNQCIGLPIVPVKVKGRDGNLVITNVFLDGGSNMSFCSKELKEKLDLNGTKTNILLTTLDKMKTPINGELFDVQILDVEEKGDFMELTSIMCGPVLPVTDRDIPRQSDIDRWPHLKSIQICHEKSPVGILIGNDHPELLQPLDVIHSQNGGPYAVKTILGWTVNGPLGRPDNLKNYTVNFIRKEDSILNQQFQEYCDREFPDSLADSTVNMSRNDLKAVKIMDESVKKKDGHYEIDLPLKYDAIHLPDNKISAEHRLDLLKKKLLKNDDMKKQYTTFMDVLFDKGYAEVIPEEDIEGNSGMIWYLPHHAVMNPNKKMRVVFDCSAKYRNLSLNEILLQGPDLNNALLGVLLRFRKFPIAMTSDVEAMFYQVMVSTHHRDLLRFLWWRDGDMDKKPEICRMKVHIFGSTSSPFCCSYALKKTAEDNKNVIDDITYKTVYENFYVDDCLVSTKDEESAIHLREQLSDVLADGGFNLTKWSSNSTKVLESVPEVERAVGVKSIDLSHLNEAPVERALGVSWNIHTDRFMFNKVDAFIKDKPITRRGILSMISAIYDPLGFISPVVLPVKKILQTLCKLKLGWDSVIPDQYVNKWKEWLSQLPLLSQYTVDRCLQPLVKDIVSTDLHHFSDASEQGYGCVTYLRIEYSSGEVKTSFVMSKSRVAPMKSISIPRLELAAATLSVRLDSMIRKELKMPINNSIFWSDSTTVIKYILNEDKRFQTYVANRVSVIRDGSDKSDWRYVDSRNNPADDVSRGLKVSELIDQTRWLRGPSFLMEPESQWPVLTEKIEPLVSDDPEVKKSFAATATEITDSVIDNLLERYSSWYKLLSCVSWILRYKRNLQAAVRERKLNTHIVIKKMNEVKSITVKEMTCAEREIVKLVQKKCYPEEIDTLSRDQKTRVKKSSSLFKLNPVYEDDVLKVGGRLSYSCMNKKQYIMPKNHHVVRLLIRHYHQMAGHSGREYVLSLLRNRFWIIHGNSTVRRELSKCIDCKKIQGRVGQQKMADVPEDRLNINKSPFTSTGVDFFGHFTVRRGRSNVKRYALLFTCLTTRAVHIEITPGLDTNSFLNAINRFISRRGKPEIIRSDNGGSFVKGEKEIREGIAAWNQSHIQTHLLQKEIQWIFNPPLGSHHGGIWERCIRTARKILSSLLREQVVDDDGLCTIMCEVEAIMNARPLTKVSDDQNDLEALTPNHLLMFKAAAAKLPMDCFYKDDQYQRRWRHIQYIADIFWRRWIKQYLPLLQERHKWNYASKNFSVGDIVLLVDTTVPRNAWPLGRIVQVYPGRDQLVRSVQVRTMKGLLRRPIDKLILLDGKFE